VLSTELRADENRRRKVKMILGHLYDNFEAVQDLLKLI